MQKNYPHKAKLVSGTINRPKDITVEISDGGNGDYCLTIDRQSRVFIDQEWLQQALLAIAEDKAHGNL